MFLLSDDDQSMITLYINLTNISGQLQASMCHHLVNYVHETLYFWHNLIKEKLSKYVFFLVYIQNIVPILYSKRNYREYNDLLKILKWPFCGTNATSLSTTLPETMTRFKILIEYLFHLQLPYPYNI